MSVPNDVNDTTLLAGHLQAARRQAEAGEFGSALASAKEAKSLEPGNVYVLAFEKQLELLVRLAQGNMLSDDQRADILDSIPGIIERALDGTSGASPDVNGPAADASDQAQEKAAALEWLKNQYFQHAHEYVKKGQYSHALAEIRRVYIIDPQNKTAQEFEHQIKQLSSLNAPPPAPRPIGGPPPRVIPVTAPPPPPRAPERPTPLPPQDEPDAMPTMAEEWSSPATVKSASHDRPIPPTPKRGMNTSMLLMIFLLIAVIGASIFYFAIRPKRNPAHTLPVITGGQTESFAGGTTTAAEQSFVVSGENETTPVAPPKEDKSTKETTEKSTPETETPVKEVVKETPKKKPEPPPPQQSAPSPATDVASNPLGSAQNDAATTTPSQEESAKPFNAVEREPQIVKLENPQFNDESRRLGLVGEVDVEVQIGKDGIPLQARIKRSTNPALDDALIDAVMRSKFSPAQMSSGPVTSWMKIPYRFKPK